MILFFLQGSFPRGSHIAYWIFKISYSALIPIRMRLMYISLLRPIKRISFSTAGLMCIGHTDYYRPFTQSFHMPSPSIGTSRGPRLTPEIILTLFLNTVLDPRGLSISPVHESLTPHRSMFLRGFNNNSNLQRAFVWLEWYKYKGELLLMGSEDRASTAPHFELYIL